MFTSSCQTTVKPSESSSIVDQFVKTKYVTLSFLINRQPCTQEIVIPADLPDFTYGSVHSFALVSGYFFVSVFQLEEKHYALILAVNANVANRIIPLALSEGKDNDKTYFRGWLYKQETQLCPVTEEQFNIFLRKLQSQDVSSGDTQL
jgi:hypothetical protein